MIEIRCACGESYHAEEIHAGRSIRCQKCGAILKVERQSPCLDLTKDLSIRSLVQYGSGT